MNEFNDAVSDYSIAIKYKSDFAPYYEARGKAYNTIQDNKGTENLTKTLELDVYNAGKDFDYYLGWYIDYINNI